MGIIPFPDNLGDFFCAISSAVERLFYTQLVGGSNPSSRTIFQAFVWKT